MLRPNLISVIVISKDERLLSRTLSDLRSQCVEHEAECLVVDVSRGRLDAIREEHPWVRWIDFTGPLGRRITLAHQRNVGVRFCSGSVVAFCDVGGEPQENWLQNLTLPILAGTADATCGKIVSGDSPWQSRQYNVPDGADVKFVVTANFAVSRLAVEAIGGFDEVYSYGEDVDFGWRLQDAGYRLNFVSDAVMVMKWGDFSRNIRRMRSYGFGNAYHWFAHPHRRLEFIRKWPDLVGYSLWIATFPFVIVIALLWKWWAIAIWLSLPIAAASRALPRLNPVRLLQLNFAKTFGFFSGVRDWLANDHVKLALAYDPASELDHRSVEQLRGIFALAAIPSVGVPWPDRSQPWVRAVVECQRLAKLRLRGVTLLMTATETRLRLSRLFNVATVARPCPPTATDGTVQDVDAHDNERDQIVMRLLIKSIDSAERFPPTRSGLSISTLITEGSVGNLPQVLTEIGQITLPANWTWRFAAFGKSACRLLDVRPRMAKADGGKRAGYRQDPFGAIADGWHPYLSSIVLLTGNGPLELALTQLLIRRGVVVIAPSETGRRCLALEVRCFDPSHPETLRELVLSAIEGCGGSQADAIKPFEEDLVSRWSADVRFCLERTLSVP